jgi:hypothetical protein
MEVVMKYEVGYEWCDNCGETIEFNVKETINNNGIIKCSCGEEILACSICKENGCSVCSTTNIQFDYCKGEYNG